MEKTACRRMASPYRATQPPDGLRSTAGHSIAIEVAKSEIELSFRVALASCSSVAARGFWKVAASAKALVKAVA